MIWGGRNESLGPDVAAGVLGSQIVNPHLLKDLTERGLWNEEMKNQIIAFSGSIQVRPAHGAGPGQRLRVSRKTYTAVQGKGPVYLGPNLALLRCGTVLLLASRDVA